MAEWGSSRGYLDRVTNLRAGVGPGGMIRLQVAGAGRTVFDDGDIDTLWGGSDRDWFLAATTDVVKDKKNDESFDLLTNP